MADKRHERRLKIVQNLYAWETNKNIPYFPNREEKVLEKTEKIKSKIKEIDEYIKKYATKLPFDKIAKVDLSILRLGIYELLYDDSVPDKVAIDEAINLAKELGSARSYAFVNAIMEKVFKAKNES